jgi:hypothetical protein
MKPFWSGVMMAGLVCVYAAPAMAADQVYSARTTDGMHMRVAQASASFGREPVSPHRGHGNGTMHRRFIYVPAVGYAPAADAEQDTDSQDGNDEPSSGNTQTVYYAPSGSQPAPYPGASARAAPAPVAAAPVILRSVHGQVWKYTHDGQTTYTNVAPPAGSKAQLMFSYAQSCTRECTYTTDR